MAISNSIIRRSNLRKTAAYQSWAAMLTRCTNPRQKSWHLYGGRGIKVCKRWRSFKAFLADMGERPPGHSLDRYPDKNGDYSASNCRWATPNQQGRNTRRNTKVLYDGKLLCLPEWAEILGLNLARIRFRFYKGYRPPDLFFAGKFKPGGPKKHRG